MTYSNPTMLPKLAEWHVYGNEQQGRFLTKFPEQEPTYYGTDITDDIKNGIFSRQLGKKSYELKDHLGNVRVTFSDIKMPTGTPTQPFRVDFLSKSEYYPYGMKINDLSYIATGARYGYNGTHEQDLEVNADGNYLDFGNFGYDTRVAMRRNQEPLRAKYLSLSGYSAFGSNPIRYMDIDGFKPTAYEAYLMSIHAYKATLTVAKGELVGGWKPSLLYIYDKYVEDGEILLTSDAESGFKSMLYERVKYDGTLEFAYATAGTEDLEDWGDNVAQRFGISTQYDLSGFNAKLINELFDGVEVTFVGHSLGGALAAYNSLLTGRNAITFNPDAVSSLTLLKNGLFAPDGSKIQNFIYEGEILDAVTVTNHGIDINLSPDNSFFGRLNRLLNPSEKFKNHKLDGFKELLQFDPDYNYIECDQSCEGE